MGMTDEFMPHGRYDGELVIAAIKSAERDAHNAAIEEAHSVAREWLEQYAGRNPTYVTAQKWASDAMADVAEHIRALKHPTPEEKA